MFGTCHGVKVVLKLLLGEIANFTKVRFQLDMQLLKKTETLKHLGKAEYDVLQEMKR